MSEHHHDEDKTHAFIIPRAGLQLAQYTIVDRVGVGGMGQVFVASDTKLKRQVALKFLSPQFISDETFRARFIREAQSAAALNHPNIVTIYEVADQGNQVYIAMEFIEGQSLKEVIQARSIDVETNLRIMEQICDGLAAAHAAGLVHRDLKPQNIMIDRTKRIRILDFGLAKAQGDDQLTQAGTAIGTVNYMSPEQAAGGEADQRSDIFALGILFFELLSGQLPFKRGNMPATLHAIVHEPAPPLQQVAPHLPGYLQPVIDRALAKQPDNRYQAVDQMLADIRVLQNDLSMARMSNSVVYATAPRQAVRSLAVLHLRNIGSADDEFLSYGITEDLIVDLTRLGTVRVAPMRSVLKFKDTDDDLDEIAARLNVTLILDGSIHKSGDTIRVSAQLVDIVNNESLWAERWEESADNLPRVKQALADGIARALRIDQSEVEAAQVGTPEAENPRAYENYLRGKFTFDHKKDQSDIEIALGLYRQATRQEPTLLAARAGIAEILIHQGRFAEAEKELRSAFEEADERKLLADQATLLLLLARFHIRRSNLKEAWAYGQRAMEITRELKDKAGEAETLGTLIQILQPQARFDEALRLFDRVLEISRQLDDYEKVAEALKNMGVAYSRKGDYDRAIGLYEEALELSRSKENFSLMAACLSNIGNVHYFRGDLDAAYIFYEQALDINSRLGDQAGTARQNLNMGLIQLMRVNYKSGLELLDRSAATFEELGDRGMYALAILNISQIQLILGNCAASIEAATTALTIAQEVNLPLIECDANLRLGTAYGCLGKPEESLSFLTEALEVAERAQMTRNISHINLGLASYWRDAGNLAEARKYASKSQSTARDIGDRPALIQATAFVAAITAAEGLYFAGIKQLRHQYEEALALGDVLVTVQVGRLLGQTLLACGKGDADHSEGHQVLEAVLKTARERDLANDIVVIEKTIAQFPV